MGSVLAIDARLDYDSSYYDSVTNRYKSKDDPVPENETKERFYSFNYIHETDKNYLEAFYQYSIFDRSYYEGSTSDFHGTIKDIGLKDRFDYGTSDFIQLGGGYQQYRYKSSSLYESMNKSFDNRNLYLTNVNKFFGNKTLINESIRYDDYRPFQDKTTYKIGVKQYLFEETYLSVNYGTGYNVPSFYQLFGTYGPNPNLKPESTTGYDVFVSRKGIKVGYFKSWVEDLITYVNNQYTNIDGESKFEGIEASYSSQFFDNFMINIAYTHLIRAEDSQENDLPRRAKNMFNYSLSWYPTDKHTININGTYVGKRYDDTAKTIQTGKYNVTNVVLRHNFAKDFTGEIEVRNLFDRFYQEVDGYGTAGRSIYVGISAKY
jgi:vitamin B12 transporter